MQIRKRTKWLIGGSIAVLVYLFYSDPNGGSLTAAFLGQLAVPVIAVWFAYLARKALFDYLDLEELYLKAKTSSIGSGLIFIGTCLVMYGLLGLFGGQLRAEPVESYIPKQAYALVPTVKAEQNILWVDHPKVTYLQDLSSMNPAYPSPIQSVGIPKVS